jgi:hypothetical protein
MRAQLLRFNGAVERDPAIDAWMKEHRGELGAIAHEWFEVMRKCGDEVLEILHDGCPVACLGDAPFGYVNVFTSHVNVGFFHGAALPDPARLLQGTGKFMRHVKLRPGTATRRRIAQVLRDCRVCSAGVIRALGVRVCAAQLQYVGLPQVGECRLVRVERSGGAR